MGLWTALTNRNNALAICLSGYNKSSLSYCHIWIVI